MGNRNGKELLLPIITCSHNAIDIASVTEGLRSVLSIWGEIIPKNVSILPTCKRGRLLTVATECGCFRTDRRSLYRFSEIKDQGSEDFEQVSTRLGQCVERERFKIMCPVKKLSGAGAATVDSWPRGITT